MLMTTTLSEQLESLDSLEKAATPGPWSIPHLSENCGKCRCPYILSECFFGSVADISVDNGKKVSEGGNDGPPMEQAIANGKLIPSLRNIAPQLIAVVRAAAEVHKKHAHHDDCLDDGGAYECGFYELRQALTALSAAIGDGAK